MFDNAENLIDSLVNSFAYDVVAIYNQAGEQVFEGARPLKVMVTPNAKLMTHPVETGATTTDYRILEPVRLELSMILRPQNYRDTYSEILDLYTNGTLLTVQTTVDVYTNQIIEGPPHDEDPQIAGTISMSLKLTEVQFAATVTSDGGGISPRSRTNSDTTDRGTQQPKIPDSGLADLGKQANIFSRPRV